MKVKPLINNLKKNHRKRIWDRIKKHGASTLTDIELLEVLLYAINPRTDTKDKAKEILNQFGSLSELLMQNNIFKSEKLKDLTILVKNIIPMLADLRFEEAPVILDTNDLRDYLNKVPLSEKYFYRVLYLNSKNIVLADKIFEKRRSSDSYTEDIYRYALKFYATSLIAIFYKENNVDKNEIFFNSLSKNLKKYIDLLDLTLHGSFIVYQSKEENIFEMKHMK